eukprot:CAMPEP_0114336038 /NCGR_PEP_ID=MMETSP0101-20121206/5446_1 /TAXON_ID=38822 ORGANISM="Pteridomonas danica, Strain PT" /NCGR_SAMPLE_ID=MMETSP0101 /ASSEMBLY_ACC=CAM_ASM_000211 /LENGTH=32 /DNA_ID= /DNA_START= /DNA_END= /DNA_ORIENTATION=
MAVRRVPKDRLAPIHRSDYKQSFEGDDTPREN